MLLLVELPRAVQIACSAATSCRGRQFGRRARHGGQHVRAAAHCRCSEGQAQSRSPAAVSNAHRVQLDLFYDYRTNVELYPAWQAFLRESRPPTLIFWGQGDIFFTPEGGEAYLRDLPEAELVRLDSGHFAVEDSLPQIREGITRWRAPGPGSQRPLMRTFENEEFAAGVVSAVS
jgi:pimeloyl-ACP methyl ester carboxylesterase